MKLESAQEFDKSRNFISYFNEDKISSTLWLIEVYNKVEGDNDIINTIKSIFVPPFDSEKELLILQFIKPYENYILKCGTILSNDLGEISPNAIDDLEWDVTFPLLPAILVGNIKIDLPNDNFLKVTRKSNNQIKPLEKMLTIENGNRKYPLTCSVNPLESFAGDLSIFEGIYKVAIRVWPDSKGQLFVYEACPLLNLPGYSDSDFAQGRIYLDNKTGDISIRVTDQLFLNISDKEFQKEISPFVGTAIALYCKREFDRNTGKTTLTNIYENYWILCRLRDPKDEQNNLDIAPAPSKQNDNVLCIGGTPPYNWQGPNIRTHFITPLTALGLTNITERRLVFGKIIESLPGDINNTYTDVRRIMKVFSIIERDTDIESNWATRLVIQGKQYSNVDAISYLTSAVELTSKFL